MRSPDYGTCNTCGGPLKQAPCPADWEGCGVFHIHCPKCAAREEKERLEAEDLDALRKGSGVE